MSLNLLETVKIKKKKILLCDNLEGWDGVGDGKEVQEGGDICIPMTDSHRCMAEINITL